MSGQVYPLAHWYRARRLRAQQGRAPRLAIQRTIYMRQQPNGTWHVAIGERRFGVLRPPEWLCSNATFKQARAAAMKAWREYRLPMLWAYTDDPYMRPFHAGTSEPQAMVS